jgi:hypothetical protein
LLTGEDAWPGFVLVNEMLLYLTGSSEARLNYTTGETAVLRNDPDRPLGEGFLDCCAAKRPLERVARRLHGTECFVICQSTAR